ncbi:cardiolipin synthase [Aeromonas bestiarum]|uniref:cardiolipin synthase n=1 Tax=Aeromonas bestiarum TaxID=105751 RepID=UPI0005087B40|nr:cardiolipin synthase [Aeromonas bestiarum]EKP0279738.1 cardiolipin synthase [Aeromonas bestiarum]KFN21029.1 cardiolipin synthetase [Aeromonas bestiarum]POG23773.1 cardiolipin synthase [Aeromonas bestiarum]HEH9403315.1 cardiolipin synthase [Aeromonas bestiarum]
MINGLEHDIQLLFSQFLGWLLLLFHTVIVTGVSLRVVMKRRPIGVSLAWLALIYAIPFAGVGFYVLFGEIRLGRRRAERAQAMYRPYAIWIRQLARLFPQHCCEVGEKAQPLHDLIQSRLAMPMLSGNRMTLLSRPESILREIVRDIRQSSQSCYLEFYIWHPGGDADEVCEALMEVAARGVDCRLLLDSMGSKAFFRSPWPKQLRKAGVKLVEVLPVGAWRIPFQRQDLRMHRKLVVIDDRVGYTGSMNMVDPRFFKQNAGVGQWVDIMIRVQGPMVPLMWSIFVWDWEMETGERLLDSLQHEPEAWPQSNYRAQLIPSGPFVGGDCIQQSLLLAIYQARHHLVLTTPYFVPDDPLAAALSSAAARGVQVQLVLPARNDSLMANHACNAFMEELLEAGVEVYRYDAGLLHTKSVLVDDDFALVGTVNLDRRSLWLNFEVTLLIDNPVFVAEMTQLVQGYMIEATPMSLAKWRARPWYKKVTENIFYLFSPLL